ncbi:hypothetical protein D4764_07G0005000 [Takifugu flavidus]|uniref:Uncharacterized protein n=1 Tax=Takifugu flavidus TaxID=433684 RepID=A0A5C6MUG4_9TELE|nr:hypothetical protein D4764_07G0005000 [Takifugu flavidus]
MQVPVHTYSEICTSTTACIHKSGGAEHAAEQRLRQSRSHRPHKHPHFSTWLKILTFVSYDRILSIQSLSDIPNPWKGVTMNRCLVLTLTVLLMSAGMNQLHYAVDAFLEETGVRTFVGSVQDGSFAQISVWDSLTWWWRSEDVGALRKRKKPMANRAMLKPKPKE